MTFEHIHPFIDGNGRIGCALSNCVLNREGYVPINTKFVDRVLYYEVSREFGSAGRTAAMEEIVGRALTNSCHKRLAYLEGVPIISLAATERKRATVNRNRRASS